MLEQGPHPRQGESSCPFLSGPQAKTHPLVHSLADPDPVQLQTITCGPTQTSHRRSKHRWMAQTLPSLTCDPTEAGHRCSNHIFHGLQFSFSPLLLLQDSGFGTEFSIFLEIVDTGDGAILYLNSF